MDMECGIPCAIGAASVVVLVSACRVLYARRLRQQVDARINRILAKNRSL